MYKKWRHFCSFDFTTLNIKYILVTIPVIKYVSFKKKIRPLKIMRNRVSSVMMICENFR